MYASDTPDSVDCTRVVRDLVARFGQHLDSYKQQTYNETQVRREFIDPFFTALGWDVDNKAGPCTCQGVAAWVVQRTRSCSHPNARPAQGA